MYESNRVCHEARVRELATHLFREEHGYLLAVARRNSADRLDAEEALQDAFLIFVDRFRPDTDTPPLAWLTLTLKRHCWAVYRRRRDAPDVPGGAVLEALPDAAPSPEEAAEAAELLAGRRVLLRGLRPAQRRALGLVGLGYSYREIMAATGWTYTKVNRSISEGRARLRTGVVTHPCPPVAR